MKRILISVALVLACFGNLAHAATIYVSKQGSDANIGSSWASAKLTVSAALSVAQSTDEVWVARGAYVENINMRNGVALYGGFSGTEALRSQRNWKVNETTLDGNRSGSVVTVGYCTHSNTRIDGFTVTNGLARNGGGIFMQQNEAWKQNSFVGIANNRIVDNAAVEVSPGDGLGGGIYCMDATATASIVLQGNIIANNSGRGGGGVYAAYVDALISRNTISGNRGRGAVELSGRFGSIDNNLLYGNLCTAFILSNASNPCIANNTIVGNAGGIWMSDRSAADIANNIIWSNGIDVLSHESGGIPSLWNNCVSPNGYGGVEPGSTDISADPLLDADYRLTGLSPCIDAGRDSYAISPYDFDGEQRVWGLRVDIGADEYQPIPEPSGLLALALGIGGLGMVRRRR